MKNGFLRLACLLLPLLLIGPFISAQPLLKVTLPNPTVEWLDAKTLKVGFQISEGNYLYRDRLRVTLTPAKPLTLKLPAAALKEDPYFGKTWVYYHALELIAPLAEPLQNPAQLTIDWQGCSEKEGFCYPPETARFSVGPQRAIAPHTAIRPKSLNSLDAAAPLSQPKSATGSLFSADQTPYKPAYPLSSSSAAEIAWTLLSFYGAGLLMAVSVCMYPFVPIISAIVVGSQQKQHRKRAIWLSTLYVQGLAISYTIAGVVSAGMGWHFTLWMQDPWVSGSFALLMVALAASVLGLYRVPIPNALQQRLIQWSHQLSRGRAASTFALGVLSALILGPCATPILAAALLYIAQTGDLWLGGISLYALALGLGTPLFAVGVFGAQILPRSGRWMAVARYCAAASLLATAVWLAKPLWSDTTLKSDQFATVDSVPSLQSALKEAYGKPVLLDFYADWCLACVQMEKTTWTDPEVKKALEHIVPLRVDLTQNTRSQRELLTRFQLFGPPAIVFFNRNGQAQLDQNAIGYLTPDEALKLLNKLRSTP